MEMLQLGEISITLTRKSVKHVHLSVHPPEGNVTLVAPVGSRLEVLRAYAIKRLAWIRKQQQQLRTQPRETKRRFVTRESHYVWGKQYLLRVVEEDAAPMVQLKHSMLQLRVRPGSDEARRGELLEAWYRQQIRKVVPGLLAKWQALMGVEATGVRVQRMKTKWGSCNPKTGLIRLNTDLARKPLACLEYILVHELAHLIEPTHSVYFQDLMDGFMPAWRQVREELNSLPVRHEEWE